LSSPRIAKEARLIVSCSPSERSSSRIDARRAARASGHAHLVVSLRGLLPPLFGLLLLVACSNGAGGIGEPDSGSRVDAGSLVEPSEFGLLVCTPGIPEDDLPEQYVDVGGLVGLPVAQGYLEFVGPRTDEDGRRFAKIGLAVRSGQSGYLWIVAEGAEGETLVPLEYPTREAIDGTVTGLEIDSCESQAAWLVFIGGAWIPPSSTCVTVVVDTAGSRSRDKIGVQKACAG